MYTLSLMFQNVVSNIYSLICVWEPLNTSLTKIARIIECIQKLPQKGYSNAMLPFYKKNIPYVSKAHIRSYHGPYT